MATPEQELKHAATPSAQVVDPNSVKAKVVEGNLAELMTCLEEAWPVGMPPESIRVRIKIGGLSVRLFAVVLEGDGHGGEQILIVGENIVVIKEE